MMKALKDENEKFKFRRIEKRIKITYIAICILFICILNQDLFFKPFGIEKKYILLENIGFRIFKEILMVASLSSSGLFLLFLLYKRFNDEYHLQKV